MEGTKSILLIDDDNISNYLVSVLLSSLESKLPLVVANNATEAIKYFSLLNKTSRVLVLLDIHMPILDGFEILESIKEVKEIDASQLDIVIISSSIAQKDLVKARKNGITKFLVKPFIKENLQTIIDEFQLTGNSTPIH